MGCDRNAGEPARKSVELPVDDEFSLAVIDGGLAIALRKLAQFA